jgi:hypothetical protein
MNTVLSVRQRGFHGKGQEVCTTNGVQRRSRLRDVQGSEASLGELESIFFFFFRVHYRAPRGTEPHVALLVCVHDKCVIKHEYEFLQFRYLPHGI